jgi:hypothetical protein
VETQVVGERVVVADEDGTQAATAALAYERAAVWVGPAGTPAWEEFCAEVGLPGRPA